MKPFDKKELLIRLDKLIELRILLQSHYGGQIRGISANQDDKVASVEHVFLQKIRDFVIRKMNNSDISVDDVAQNFELNKTQLYRKIKALTGLSPTLFIRGVRIQHAMELLKSSKMNVSEVAYETGFSDPSYFSRVFKETYGISPSDVS